MTNLRQLWEGTNGLTISWVRTVHIVDDESVAEISEHISENSTYFSLDKSDPVLAAVSINPHSILQRGICHYHHL